MSPEKKQTLKLLKVDNWSVFLLQRLQLMFAKGDCCDLTLKFGDLQELKVINIINFGFLFSSTNLWELTFYFNCKLWNNLLWFCSIKGWICRIYFISQLKWKINFSSKLFCCYYYEILVHYLYYTVVVVTCSRFFFN